MRISRLYVPIALSQGKKIELDNDSAHYLRTVLRLKAEAEIILFNGTGGEFSCIVDEVNRKTVLISVNQWHDKNIESPLLVSLGLGISRGDRMDLSVQKAVELGVNCITPLLTERCVVQFKGEKKPQRWQHWQKIIHHATEQCGRTAITEFNEISPIANWVSQQQGLKLFLDPYAETSLAELQPVNGTVTLLTGPEGGFSGQEREDAKVAGFIPVQLGQRILRTETASLAALSAIQMLWGDFNHRKPT
ncbi:MAG: 16S rRNA (uracil(1498)-N(3))-methyltransferase [Methylococcaceae bacterium]|nr:16S rRNA (uracil(1498)-N(3))-methyltransferase [Methylococcaceae bacterium]